MQISELMTPDPLSLTEDENVDLAEMFMHFAHIRHLPVVDEPNGHVRGLVTHWDLLRASVKSFAEADDTEEGIPVRLIMRRDVLTVPAATAVEDALQLMRDHKYGCLPVTEYDRLVGIVTEADVLDFTLRLLRQKER